MRLIDADALRERMYHEAFETDTDMQKWDSGCWIRYKIFENALEDAPTVDTVKHGEWRYDEALELEWCSECGFGKRKGDKRWYSYCPNCGCKMEVVKHETC